MMDKLLTILKANKDEDLTDEVPFLSSFTIFF